MGNHFLLSDISLTLNHKMLERLPELIHFILKIMGDGNPRKAWKAILEGLCL